MEVGGLLLVVLFSLIWTCCSFQHVSFTIEVRANTREYFYETLGPGDVVRMDWQVIKGGDFDIDFFHRTRLHHEGRRTTQQRKLCRRQH